MNQGHTKGRIVMKITLYIGNEVIAQKKLYIMHDGFKLRNCHITNRSREFCQEKIVIRNLYVDVTGGNFHLHIF